MLRKSLGLARAPGGPRTSWMASAALLTGLLACAVPARAGDPPPPPSEAQLAAARAAAKALGEALKAQLVAAIQTGGPSAAVGVCRTVAPAIAAEASQSPGLKVGRTALKVRNPANAPDGFERKVLAEFVRKIAEGADPATLEHAEVVAGNDGPVLRYMKAIPTAAEPCLACHGGTIDPALQAEILALYPQDQATGFAAGELRGAFTVTQTVK